VEQEWGPSEPSPNTLADITLGSVPSGTDYLEIWVNLTRVVNPARILDLTLASMFPQGQWVKLVGYSCVIEETLGVARQFEFVLDGTTVKLRRFQSINASGGIMPGAYGTRSNPGGSSDSAAFFYPGTNAPVDPS